MTRRLAIRSGEMPILSAAPAALVRAAQRAREIAARTGMPLILAQHGKAIEKIITADMIAPVSDKE